MMNIVVLFWMYVFLFAIVGAMRGWAKELIVSFSVILALALNYLVFQFVPFVADMAVKGFFWLRTLTLLALVFFGYQTVAMIPHLASRARREKVQDTILGSFFGAINGYLIAGTVLYYVHVANYPYPGVISPPPDTFIDFVGRMMLLMPPQVFGVPLIYFAVIVAFIFVIVVYI